MDDTRPERAPLPDLTRLRFGDIRALGDVPLARSLRHVIEDLDDPDGVISAFQSFAADE